MIVHDDNAFLDWRKVSNGLSLAKKKQLDLRCFYHPHETMNRERPERLRKNNVTGRPTLYSIGHKYPEFCHGPCMAAMAAASKAILAAEKTCSAVLCERFL